VKPKITATKLSQLVAPTLKEAVSTFHNIFRFCFLVGKK